MVSHCFHPGRQLLLYSVFVVVILNGYAKKGTHKLLPKIRCRPDGTCSCPEDPLTERYADPEDPTCVHYYLCHLGRAFKKRCVVRMAFHPELGECAPRQQVPERVCRHPVDCPVFQNRYVEDPEDCTKYFLCFYQQPLHYGCDSGYYFEPEKESCLKDEDQADECRKAALENIGQSLGLRPPPPKNSSALTQAKKRKNKPEIS